MNPLIRNTQLTTTDTPGDTPEGRLFNKTLHFSCDIVVPQILSDGVAQSTQEVADAMAVAATTVLFDIATQINDTALMLHSLKQKPSVN